MPEPLWTVDELASYLRKPKSWVYDNHRALGIPSFRVGQSLRFVPTEVATWVQDQREF